MGTHTIVFSAKRAHLVTGITSDWLQLMSHDHDEVRCELTSQIKADLRAIVQEWDREEEEQEREDTRIALLDPISRQFEISRKNRPQTDLTEVQDIAGFADRHDASTCSLCSTPKGYVGMTCPSGCEVTMMTAEDGMLFCPTCPTTVGSPHVHSSIFDKSMNEMDAGYR